MDTNVVDKAEEVKDVKYSYDDAVEMAGHGCYNRLVLVACSVISNAVALDMFGFGVVLAAASCDLQLGITHIGVLASMPFAGLFFAFPWGYYADTRGRRRALLLSCAVGFIMAALGSFSPILALLILPLTFNIPIPWLSITYRPWRLLTLLCAIPLGVGAVMMYFLYESPKFLANSGENDKALEVLRKIFKINGGKKENYQVKELENNQSESQSKLKFWESISEQTVPIFKPPLLWRTLQLFYLLVLCCSTNNVFVMWYPTIVNSFFTSFSKDVIEDQNFCDRVVDNIAAGASETGDLACDDTISYNTIYSGILYGSFFTIVNLLAAKLATWRRLVLIIILILSAVCSALINLIREPISSMVLFTLLQGTSVAIGAVASYFLDLYPTSYRGLATSLGMMTARFGSFTGVNIIGFAITSNCGLTFYCWSAFVFSGVAVALLLPSDSKGT
ncbi:hypothetical protein MSG28_008308 [Choristoneura fumiferana]|uniref:Uncharacterized protein n=1 Tax=Choristoneura fumiferana TaxID=7141 RepID=A0ACC0JAU2_CHOFU|nr:hypothetical protein MSG28_008308 [Choristoneura fumiferana]